MERDRVNYLNRLSERDKRLFAEEPMGVNLAELIRQTDAGKQPKDWEVYSKVIVGDKRSYTTFYKKFTYDGKISVIKDEKGSLSISEYDYDYAKRILGESYIQVTKKSSLTSVFTPAVTMLRRKVDGGIAGFGNIELANEFESRFEKLNPPASVWEHSVWEGEEVTAEERAVEQEKELINSRDETNTVSTGAEEVEPQEPVNEPEGSLEDTSRVVEAGSVEEVDVEAEEEESELHGVAAIIAATATALERQFDIERNKDKEEIERRLSEQQEKHDEILRKIQEQHALEMEELGKTYQAQVDGIRADYERKIDELNSNNISTETVSEGYPDDIIDIEFNQESEALNEKPEAEEARDEKLYNGAVKGEDGKFKSLKKNSEKKKTETGKSKVSEEIAEMNHAYELSNGWVINSPWNIQNMDELKSIAERVIDDYYANNRSLAWIEIEFWKELKKMKKSYTKEKLHQVKLVPLAPKKEEQN